MAWLRRSLRTNWVLWAVVSLGLLTSASFINPMPDIKGSFSLWGEASNLLSRNDVPIIWESVARVGLYALVLAVPAVVFGWVVQACIVLFAAVLGGSKG